MDRSLSLGVGEIEGDRCRIPCVLDIKDIWEWWWILSLALPLVSSTASAMAIAADDCNGSKGVR